LDIKNDWKPNVYGQVKSWIDGGLEPRAVTRDLDWGIDVPVEGARKKYTWFDAPIGYISSTKEWAFAKKRLGTILERSRYKTGSLQRNTFHIVIFPAMLKAEGSYILPDNVPANEF
jgi:methionyl-tRNA synthetase